MKMIPVYSGNILIEPRSLIEKPSVLSKEMTQSFLATKAFTVSENHTLIELENSPEEFCWNPIFLGL